MPDEAEDLFEDESLAASEGLVDETIRAAGGAREAVRALLIRMAETERARSAQTSLGYRRGRQPARRLP